MQLRHSRHLIPSGTLLQLHLLGPMRCEVRAGEVSLAARKSRGLLAYLGSKAGVPVSRESITALLWGDRSGEQARASVRQTLVALRKAIGGDADKLLIASNEHVSLANDCVWTDVSQLDRISGDAPLSTLEAIAELFRGDFLEGLYLEEPAFEQWLTAERERVRASMLQVSRWLITRLEQDGRIEDAIKRCASTLVLDPLQESVHRNLMRLYVQQGRLDAALNQFEQCRRELSEQLKIAPDAETLQLAAEVRTRRRQVLVKPETSHIDQTAQPLRDDAADPSRIGPALHHILPDKPSIAVLPFINMSADPEQEFFSDGISEDIITELGRYGELFVIARNSSFRFRKSGVPPHEIGEKLGVRYLLEGSVRRSVNRIRVTAQLIDATTEKQVWADRYDRDLTDIFGIQDELSQTIVSTVKGRVDTAVDRLAALKPTVNLSAYECLLRGQAVAHRHKEEEFAEARKLFEAAISLDPGFARAFGWLAYVDCFDRLYWRTSNDQLERAIQIGEKGLLLDANDSRCHLALGFCFLFKKEHYKAEHHLMKASSLNPNDDHIMVEIGRLKLYIGAAMEGAAWVRRGMRQNPFHPNWYWNVLARCLHTAKDYLGAISALEHLEIVPFWSHTYLAACYAELGEMDKARKHVDLVLSLRPDFSLAIYAPTFPFRDETDLDDLLNGLRKAGLPP